MKVIILSGGYGTRLQEETSLKPKPMVEIGGRPMLWHIMGIYAAYGFKEFVIALGYRAEVVRSYFLHYRQIHSDITVCLGDGSVAAEKPAAEDWTIHLIDTGDGTGTGGRIRRLADWIGDETFMLTYGDGVADIDIRRLVAFHKAHGKLATITAVRPPSRFGGLRLDGDAVLEFEEKPQIGEGWINGGFFVLEPQVLTHIPADDTLWERGPLESLAAAGELRAYRHEGFWQPMDTLRDVRLLESLWSEGRAPWKVWK
ncbi:MAG TPA: glucose-1-phosphate cytidylyltransferase [Gemmatimonadaceae bacterium]|jgi:glucose-1-phosphate cytidylyltransferase|nr:glucose-1-phosphate cytidylyltransferase [Gemmatimonadaceae bacterium]